MKDEDKQNIIDAIAIMPCALEAEDVTDFCSLAQYYAMKTPTSFKQDLYPIMFGENSDEKSISHALCLPVSAQELVENAIEAPSILNTVETVRFFLVDCRPAEQYNAGHLPTAFHLDCNLVSIINYKNIFKRFQIYQTNFKILIKMMYIFAGFNFFVYI